MKVLHILSSHIYSGAENVVCQIISMFKDEPDIEMGYCSPDGTVRKALEERDINFMPVKEMNTSELKRVIVAYQPDVIHAHDMRAGFLAARACGNIPLISHIHNNAYNSRGISAKSIAYFYAALKAKSIIWVSQSSFDGYAFHGPLKKKSVILYNAINTEELKNRMALDNNSYDYDMVFVGRMVYQKNLHRLLQITRLIADEYPSVKVALAGTGEDEEELKQLCTSLKLDDNVTFLGYQSNPLKLLHDSKLMVLTSRWEGTPMVALESMALGTPIISTPSDGMIDLITDGYNGYLSDDDGDFAKKIIGVLSDENLYETLRANQLKRSAEVNNVDKYKAVIAKLYRE
ncbi:Glycosyltransferase involved in cell wall bisynthesis [Pseudobutyrivibrio sp. OR37]|uniref:glycosyltransferase n=1 Tax=Pseudobutyrivibrio sp. OR37 TaxID=1798186 RepID=UPI0008EC36F1|nr:glycosyltransferase [Pseudobutyrivibrio sp. OR37]SFI33486.1 Glycosyltransferase involved in cell wall bisynthesis [Pseudobutyrivibrio sp. OR37]